jgi:hypothetical protein
MLDEGLWFLKAKSGYKRAFRFFLVANAKGEAISAFLTLPERAKQPGQFADRLDACRKCP